MSGLSKVSRPAWLTGVVVATLLVAGCSGDEPQAQPPRPSAPSTSPVTTRTPTPTPPALPPAARRNTKAGAVAFVYHFVDLLNYTSVSGETGTFSRTTQRSCHSCRNIKSAIDEIYAAGGSVKGGELTIRSYTQVPGQSVDAWRFVLKVHAEQQIVRRSAGDDAETIPPSSSPLTIDIARIAGDWRVLEMEKPQ